VGEPPVGQGHVGQPAYAPPGYGQPVFGQTAYGAAYQAAPRDPDRRPVTVTVAAVLTWIAAGVTAGLMLLFIMVLALSGDSFVDEFQTAAPDRDLSLTSDQVMAIGWGVGAVMLFWSVAAIVLAVLAFRRNNAGRIALVVSAAMTVLLSLVAIMSVISLVPLIMAVAVLILLFAGGANAWYSRRSGAVPGGPVGGWPGQPAPQQERPKPW
jgi:hypothetical protein